MANNTNTNIANGIISAIVTACGIVLSILVGLMFKKLIEMVTFSLSAAGFSSATYSAYTGYWAIGFAFIIPGVIGIIASLVRQKCGYIIQLVIAIITLVVMGIFFVVGIIALMALSLYSYTSCTEFLGQCMCNNGNSRVSVNIGGSCSDLNAISGMSIGATVMLVLGWIFVLAASITGGMLACAREDQPGVIIHGHQQPQVTVMQMGHMPQGQPGYVVQQGYGQPGYGQPGYGQSGYVAQPGYSVHSGYEQPNYAKQHI